MPAIEAIEIDLDRQRLRTVFGGGSCVDYIVSTALKGPGEQMDSECTPRGRHRISDKIGAGCESGTVFVGRVPTGEIWSPELAAEHPGRDWILTRILWLDGLEPGFNSGGACDTHSRYVYIHGTPDSTRLGEPGSHGCIRMANSDVITLFEQVEIGTPVTIYSQN